MDIAVNWSGMAPNSAHETQSLLKKSHTEQVITHTSVTKEKEAADIQNREIHTTLTTLSNFLGIFSLLTKGTEK